MLLLFYQDESIIGNKKYSLIELTLNYIPEDKFQRVSPNQMVSLSKEYDNYVKKEKDFYIWVEDKDKDFFYANSYYMNDTYKYHDFIELTSVLLLSVNYLDNDIKVLYDFEANNNFKYRFPDFLYFSAVTITTLGYGDILPNSTIIRVAVMVETITGLISIAIFSAGLYEWLKKRN